MSSALTFDSFDDIETIKRQDTEAYREYVEAFNKTWEPFSKVVIELGKVVLAEWGGFNASLKTKSGVKIFLEYANRGYNIELRYKLKKILEMKVYDPRRDDEFTSYLIPDKCYIQEMYSEQIKEAYQYMKKEVKDHLSKNLRKIDVGAARHSLSTLSFEEHLNRLEGVLDRILEMSGEHADNQDELDAFLAQYHAGEGEHETGYSFDRPSRQELGARGLTKDEIRRRIHDLLADGISESDACDILADELTDEELDLL